ncbi:phosphate-starvation-inducible PsiE family protein [Gloeocapsopsis sp. IPPAS B-1203]|uniref:phosphate-starvation-inducible PsiE family protein n=1 Tax=Gloeocapsopsis sp. IPPAS B-1203 TaxID=2049454 RepID=UPI000C18B0E3|nr:phosphate-starvation-inducible PsiE family protein [Gloeocapsopsis sp. IPPAS B-1203]PIG93209.1 hypothetical protein CSQ79_13545 [Gloeocapsopsis sp. IPPAS B-1203]
MSWLRKFSRRITVGLSDSNFLQVISGIETLVSKLLSILMVIVILVAVYDLFVILIQDIFRAPVGFFTKTLFEVFGLFLNILIALELLENITAYLRKHVIQVELVIVTSLIAVARKFIILDLQKTGGIDLIGLALAILGLSISYWIIRNAKPRLPH